MSRDRQHWLIAYLRDDAPLEYFHYDRGRRQARRLFSSNPELEGAPLVKMEPVTIQARDGLALISYLSRPRGSSPAERLSMVLLVHGGPWGRDMRGLHPKPLARQSGLCGPEREFPRVRPGSARLSSTPAIASGPARCTTI
jgi:dipeptidyl aminopeptidase/acylaminoacyl peptidase